MNTRGRFGLFALFLGAAGCAPMVNVRPATAADGLPATLIECRLDESHCLKEAQRVCPGGYYVLDAGASEGTRPMRNGVSARNFRGQMLIRCQ